MSFLGITKGYGLFSVKHLMILLTVRGQRRKPIIDFPAKHNYSVCLKVVGVVHLFAAEESQHKTYFQNTFSLAWTKCQDRFY